MKEQKKSETALPRELYRKVADRLDPVLKDAFVRYDGAALCGADLIEVCGRVVNGMGAYPTADLRKQAWGKFRKQCSRKRRRWIESLRINAEQIPPDAKTFPFSDVYRQAASISEWARLYGSQTPEEVVVDKMKQAEGWAACPDSLFVSFPALSSLTPRKIAQAIQDDVTNEAYRILTDLYGLDFSTVYRPYADVMVDIPAFAANRRKKVLPDDGLVIPMNEEHTSLLQITRADAAGDIFEPGISLTQLDLNDRTLLSCILQEALMQPGIPSQLDMPVRTLAECLVPKSDHVSTWYYKDAVRRVMNIANTTYKHYTNGLQDAAINYLDHAVYFHGQDGIPRIEIGLGDVFVDSILKKKIQRFDVSSYNSLTDMTAKAVYMQMQRIRVLTCQNPPDPKGEYSADLPYSRFLRMVPLSGGKLHNWSVIKKAMQDMVDHQILLMKAEFDNLVLSVHAVFLPLSEDEMYDLAQSAERIVSPSGAS